MSDLPNSDPSADAARTRELYSNLAAKTSFVAGRSKITGAPMHGEAVSTDVAAANVFEMSQNYPEIQFWLVPNRPHSDEARGYSVSEDGVLAVEHLTPKTTYEGPRSGFRMPVDGRLPIDRSRDNSDLLGFEGLNRDLKVNITPRTRKGPGITRSPLEVVDLPHKKDRHGGPAVRLTNDGHTSSGEARRVMGQLGPLPDPRSSRPDRVSRRAVPPMLEVFELRRKKDTHLPISLMIDKFTLPEEIAEADKLAQATKVMNDRAFTHFFPGGVPPHPSDHTYTEATLGGIIIRDPNGKVSNPFGPSAVAPDGTWRYHLNGRPLASGEEHRAELERIGTHRIVATDPRTGRTVHGTAMPEAYAQEWAERVRSYIDVIGDDQDVAPSSRPKLTVEPCAPGMKAETDEDPSGPKM